MAKKKKKTKKTTGKSKTSRTKTKVTKTMKTTDFAVQPVNKVTEPAAKPRTKGEIIRVLSESTGLSKREVDTVFASLGQLIDLDIGKKGPGIFNVPGLMKIVRVSKPATKARKGINPFTGEETTFKAKPARNVVKVRALKALKDMVK
jgi:nucleoid DNA-binding protein